MQCIYALYSIVSVISGNMLINGAQWNADHLVDRSSKLQSKLWSKLPLSMPKPSIALGLHEAFFLMILVVRVIGAMNDSFITNLPLRNLLKTPTYSAS